MHPPEIMHLHQLYRLGLSGSLLASVLFAELKTTIRCEAMTLLWLPPGSSDARVFHESDAEASCGLLDEKSFYTEGVQKSYGLCAGRSSRSPCNAGAFVRPYSEGCAQRHARRRF